MLSLFACYHCTRTVLMAGSHPAIAVWPRVITAWFLALLILNSVLKSADKKQKGVPAVGGERFVAAAFLALGSTFVLGITTWGGLMVQGLVVVVVGLLSIRLLSKARRATLAIHAGLLLGLLATHSYYSSLQRQEGNLLFALRYGTSPDALKPMLREIPLLDLDKLAADLAGSSERGEKIVLGVLEERVINEVYLMEPATLEDLAKNAKNESLRAESSSRLRALSKQRDGNRGP